MLLLLKGWLDSAGVSVTAIKDSPLLRHQGRLDSMTPSTHHESARGLQKNGWDSLDEIR
jgi:hypothetical protein